MTHTPGPWTIKHRVNVLGAERSIASCGGYTTNADDGEHIIENEANAHLVAAAPDLLEACKAIVRYDETGGQEPFREAADLARAAVAKAAGNES